MAKRLTENHPLHKKMEQLFGLMEELGISIECDNYYTHVTSKDLPGVALKLKDSDNGERVTAFPPWVEFKLIIED